MDNEDNNLQNGEITPKEDNEKIVESNNTKINKNETTKKEVTKKEEVKYVEKNSKRNGEKGNVVVSYRKPSLFSSVLLILIGALIATIVILALYIYKTSNTPVTIYEDEQEVEEISEETPQEDDIETAVTLDLSIDGEFVQELYDKVPVLYSYGIWEVYNAGKVTAKDITDNHRLLFILKQLEAEYKYTIVDESTVISKLDNKIDNYYLGEVVEVRKYDFDTVEQRYKSVFGSSLEVPLIDAETNGGYVFEYVASDECFYGHSYQGGGGGLPSSSTKVYAAEQNEDGTEVYIYDYHIAATTPTYNLDDTYYCYIYPTSDTTSGVAIDTITAEFNTNSTTYSYIYSGKTLEELVEDYIGNGAGQFKHTYKLDTDGNYYWYSTEKIN